MVYFSKLSARVPFLSYLTLNVVNSYMNNRDRECSGEGGGRGKVGREGGAFSFTTFGSLGCLRCLFLRRGHLL